MGQYPEHLIDMINEDAQEFNFYDSHENDNMHNAEKMIRQDIASMDRHRLAYKKSDIENDVKYAYWHGFITEYIYNELMEKVRDRYNQICDDIIS